MKHIKQNPNKKKRENVYQKSLKNLSHLYYGNSGMAISFLDYSQLFSAVLSSEPSTEWIWLCYLIMPNKAAIP